MKSESGIPPIEAIGRPLRVKPIGCVRLFKRPEYMPKTKKGKNSKTEEDLEDDEKTGKFVNNAHHVLE